MNFQKISNSSKIDQIIYTPKFSAICSIGKAPFSGIAEIKYIPYHWLLEFESFEKWLLEISLTEETIEGMTRLIFDTINEIIEPKSLCVSLTASTQVHADVTAIIKK